MKNFRKPYLRRLSLLLFSLVAITAEATAQIDTMYVYRTNGDTISNAIEEVDRIVYEKPTATSGSQTVKAVDLGLSVLWADVNVGASSPEDAGGYYAWGETVEKQVYDDVTYAYYKDGTYQSLGVDIAGTEYDVARAKWGEGWHLPSPNDFTELRDNSTWTWTSQNGRYGYSVTGPNGNSIFLPAAGYRYDSAPESVDVLGNYWTSEAGYAQNNTSVFFQITKNIHSNQRNPRYWGYSVRPVYTLDSMFVCRTNGEMESYAVADVDSIVFGKPETKEIWEAVDLGLSVKWANMNVGASSPEESGGHYAWGEIEEKAYYGEDTYLYNKDGSYQKIGENIAGTEYDVAYVEGGGDWRMPTSAEFEELLKQCDWTWTTQNNINGYKVTGPNGKSIFLPAAGYRSGPNIFSADPYDSCGYYWSSSYNGSNSFYANGLYFYAGNYRSYFGRRETGLSVRAVCP